MWRISTKSSCVWNDVTTDAGGSSERAPYVLFSHLHRRPQDGRIYKIDPGSSSPRIKSAGVGTTNLNRTSVVLNVGKSYWDITFLITLCQLSQLLMEIAPIYFVTRTI